ncbi:tumor necrosis factor receptor superfamily member 14 [Perognathus longimembris pacificus]|uniref:tumor necrosis factor receptor superfamily member 14 n=1 Tax=Perognathus longimembris pacificus TaxID=214514 RepID=UPI002018FA4E|nr:tumor necrosis factor receptor superfamily member 14 [Perognathus longimembris pacificus]
MKAVLCSSVEMLRVKNLVPQGQAESPVAFGDFLEHPGHRSEDCAFVSPRMERGPAGAAPEPALCLFLLGAQQSVLAQHLCREEEYPLGAQCCPKCNRGYHVKQACSDVMGTVCVPCPPGTYTAHPNGLSQCLPCRPCEPDMGLVTWRRCSSTQNAACRCGPGHFCQDGDGEHCRVCVPHAACRPGQRVLSRGTDQQDTVCADCPPGTFSPDGTREHCLPWTKCNAWMEREAAPGTSRTDATCAPSGRWGLFLLLAIPVLALLGLLVGLRRRRRGRPAHERASPTCVSRDAFQPAEQMR